MRKGPEVWQLPRIFGKMRVTRSQTTTMREKQPNVEEVIGAPAPKKMIILLSTGDNGETRDLLEGLGNALRSVVFGPLRYSTPYSAYISDRPMTRASRRQAMQDVKKNVCCQTAGEVLERDRKWAKTYELRLREALKDQTQLPDLADFFAWTVWIEEGFHRLVLTEVQLITLQQRIE